jgi:hypothetical protein
MKKRIIVNLHVRTVTGSNKMKNATKGCTIFDHRVRRIVSASQTAEWLQYFSIIKLRVYRVHLEFQYYGHSQYYPCPLISKLLAIPNTSIIQTNYENNHCRSQKIKIII